jgi:hypothetical protein
MKFSALGLVLISTLAACSSYESQVIQQSHGVATKGPRTPGLPVALKVPRLAFVVTEAIYRMPDGSKNMVRTIDKNSIELPSYEVFTVDVKRPISGKAKIDMVLEDQYPKSINSEVDDQTIQAIMAGLVELKKVGALPGFESDESFDSSDVGTESDEPPRGGVLVASRQYMLVYDSRTSTWETSELPEFLQ